MNLLHLQWWGARPGATILAFSLAMVAGTILLFSTPWIGAVAGFATPFVALAVWAYVAFMTNLRWSLWDGRRPFFFAAADLGFMLLFAAMLLYCVATFWDSLQFLPHVLIGLVIFSLFRVAFIEFEAWLFGMLLSVVLAVFFGPYVLFVVTEPEWFLDFITAILLTAGIGLILIGSSFSLRESARGRPLRVPQGVGKTALLTSAFAFTLAVLLSATVTLSERTEVEASEGPFTAIVDLKSDRFHFRQWPRILPGQHVRILVRNRDLLAHTFTIETLGIDLRLGPGSEGLVEFSAGVGNYPIACKVPGHTDGDGVVGITDPAQDRRR
jgi:hypothetical protein